MQWRNELLCQHQIITAERDRLGFDCWSRIRAVSRERGSVVSNDLANALRHGLGLWTLGLRAEDDGAARAAFEQMVEGYHDDAELDFSRTLPDFAPIRGREAMVAWSMDARAAMKRNVDLEAGELEAIGDAVVFPVRMAARGAASGLLMQAEFAYVFRFRGDKIASATTYPSVSEALGAANEQQQP